MPITLTTTEFVPTEPTPYLTLEQVYELRAQQLDHRAAAYRAEGKEDYAVGCERKAAKKRAKAAELRKVKMTMF